MPSLSKAGPFVVVFGEEPLFLDRAIESARNWTGRTPILLDGESVDSYEFVNVCETLSLSPRVVILDNAQKIKESSILTDFVKARGPGDTDLAIFIVSRSRALGKIWKAAAQRGKSKGFPALKPWETDKVNKFIAQEAARLSVSLEGKVARQLLYFLGTSLTLIARELEKLAILAGKGGTITSQHIRDVVAPSMKAQPFAIAEDAVAKRVRKALNGLTLLVKEKGDGALIPIVSSLQRVVEQAVVTRQMLDRGDDEKIIGARFDMHPFRVKKHLVPMAQRHSVPELLRHMNRLCELDLQLKGSARSKRTLVELALISIAT